MPEINPNSFSNRPNTNVVSLSQSIVAGVAILCDIVIALSTGMIIYWLYALSGGPASYETASSFFSNGLIKFTLFLWTAAFYYHLCNGIRHLFWDMGKGFELSNLRASGIAVLVTAGILTVVTWLIA